MIKLAVTTRQVIEAVRSLVGCPYRHQGAERYGMDCAGVVRWLGRELNLFDCDVSNYSAQPNPKLLRHVADTYLIAKESIADVAPGRVIGFKMSFRGDLQHFGVMTSPTTFVHALRDLGDVREVSMASAWRRLICGVWVLPGVDESEVL